MFNVWHQKLVQLRRVAKVVFFKKLFLKEWTSDQLPISFIQIRFSCNPNIKETFTQCQKGVSPMFWLHENLILMKEMVKKCSTDQMFTLWVREINPYFSISNLKPIQNWWNTEIQNLFLDSVSCSNYCRLKCPFLNN